MAHCGRIHPYWFCMPLHTRFCCFFVSLLMTVGGWGLAAPAMADDAPPATGTDSRPAPPRPRVGLVLGGGGARGFAHLGVIAELERMRIPIDCISGASAGALIGGFYASGQPIENLKKAFADADWDGMLAGSPNRADVPFSAKRDDFVNYFNMRFGFSDGQLRLPRGAINSQEIDLFIRSLARDARVPDFGKLPIPFQAMATDLITGQPVTFNSGDLATALRASMAVPGLFEPVDYKDTLLVDGGLARQLPIENLKNQCADILIVVDVGTRALKKDQIRTVFDVIAQSTNIGVQQNVAQQMKLLDARDIVIRPDLGQYTSADFSASRELAELGQQAIALRRADLAWLSVGEDEYSAWQRHRDVPLTPVIVDHVKVQKTRIANPTLLAADVEPLVGKPLDTEAFHHTLRARYATGDYERLNYSLIEDQDGSTTLDVRAEDRAIAPNVLRFGMGLAGETEGDSTFNLYFGHTRRWVNEAGGEWRNSIVLGKDNGLRTEFYQPFAADSNNFVAASIGYHDRPYTLYTANGDKSAQFRLAAARATVEYGRSLGNYGEVRLGVVSGQDRVERDIGDPNFIDRTRQRIGGLTASAVIDQFDNPRLPRDGFLVAASAYKGVPALGASEASHSAQLRLDKAFLWDKDTVFRATLKGSSISDLQDLKSDDAFSLGGFLNLSGYKNEQLVGDRTALLRLMGYRRVATLPSAIGTGLYLGASLEAGRVWGTPDGLTQRNRWIPAGSVFAVADSLLGPFFIGLGYADGGQLTGYMYLGLDY